jgi:hemolysin activation/secretion protein
MRQQAGHCTLALALVAMMAAPAAAQEAEPLRERTGPQADPLAVPDYAEPPAGGELVEPPPPPPVVIPTAPSVQLRDVSVSTEGDGVAVPQDDWIPADAGQSGLELVHDAGAPLDAAWVRRQFEANRLIGQTAQYSRIVALVQQINRAFLQNGYANSGVLFGSRSVDETGGVLDLRLVNGMIVGGAGGLTVTWRDNRAKGLNERFIAQRMPSAQATPFNAFALERDFRLLADDPAISSVDAQLRPGDRPGEARLAVEVAPARRGDIYLTAANHRSPAVGGLRVAAGGYLRNALSAGDVISAEAGMTDGLEDATVGYSVPVLTARTRLSLRGAVNDAAVVERQLEALDIRSKEWSVQGGLTHKIVDKPLIPDGNKWSAARSLTVGGLVVHRKTTSSLLGERFSFSPGAVDGRAEYTALRLTQDYVERGLSHVLAISLTETLGLEGTRSDIPDALNPGKNFTAILAQASYARRLADALELNVRLAAQYSDGTLYTAERMSIGGENSVRGYRENLLLADRAVFGSVELAYNFSLTGGNTDDRGFDWGAFRVAGFLDGALADNAKEPDPFLKELASAGASLTWKPSDAISARVTYAEAFKNANLPGKRHLQDKGFQFHVVLRPLLLF